MNSDRNEFRNRLLALDHVNPDLKKRYDEEIGKMYEQELSPLRKAGMIGIVVILVLQDVFFGYATFSFNLPLLARLGFVAGIAFSSTFIYILITALRRGKVDLQSHMNEMTGIMWVFIVILTTLTLLLSGRVDNPVKGVQMVVNVTIFFIMGVTFLLQNTIKQSEFKVREKLLEMEYKIADLAEKMGKR